MALSFGFGNFSFGKFRPKLGETETETETEYSAENWPNIRPKPNIRSYTSSWSKVYKN